MKKKKSGKRIFAIVLLVVIGISGFYFGYDIGRMDHDEAVSYTHLDVYKRQDTGREDRVS